MALDYSLCIATGCSAARVARLVQEIAQAHDLIGSPNTLDGKGDTIALGMGIWVVDRRALAPSVYESPVVTEFGVAPPTVSVVFSVSKRKDTEAQEDAMVGVVAGVLTEVAGDAFLDSDYDTIWLLRRGDDLSLHEDELIWTTKRLLRIMQPFRRATFRVP